MPSTQESRLAAAKKYMDARIRGDLSTLLSVVTDSVQLESSRDGKFQGKDGLKAYVAKVPPTGTWGAPTPHPKTDEVQIFGKIKVLLVPIKVVATFNFADDSDLISKVVVGRA